MNELQTGQKAPSARLRTMDGAEMELGQMWEHGRSTLLIFLRHLN